MSGVLAQHHPAQRVYVPGREKEKQTVELEVCNQRMFKTELRNKWQETGECPYGENCQFAHGIKELRPVLRHPRYKTELYSSYSYGDYAGPNTYYTTSQLSEPAFYNYYKHGYERSSQDYAHFINYSTVQFGHSPTSGSRAG
nr:zinc finger CCCH domain-containing protein 15-like [Coffea arabica]